MKTQEELIKYYEKQLEKVRSAYRTDTPSSHMNERNAEVVEFWENELELVKDGRGW
jgi:hypothetical protein